MPSIAVLLAKSPLVDRYDLSSVRYISCGSAPLSSDVEEEMKRRIGSGLYVGQGAGPDLGVLAGGGGSQSVVVICRSTYEWGGGGLLTGELILADY